MPSGTVKNAWRGHRTVVLPDYQGLSIGVTFSNLIAQIHLDEGHKYYSKTSHPRMGNYRNESSLWKATSKNRVHRKDVKDGFNYKNHLYDNKRLCFSHEYIGE